MCADISMCAHPNCPVSQHCHRHQDSGTEPSEWRQAYMNFQPTNVHGCTHYWPAVPASKPKCKTCGVELNNPEIPSSLDCGGDCQACVEEAEQLSYEQSRQSRPGP